MDIKKIRELMSKNPYRVIQHTEGLELLDALEEAIKFGGHTAECPMVNPLNIDPVCTCGWQAFLTTHGASKENKS